MAATEAASPVIVTFREVERVLKGTEAVGNLNEAANRDSLASPLEKATVMAAIGNVLNELRQAEAQQGALVLTSPHHAAACRLQSLIASGEYGKLNLSPLPSGGLEAQFDTQDWFGWATVAWSKLKHLIPHPMQVPKTARADPFPDTARIALLGDWGSGLYGAPLIAEAIRNDPDGFALLLHLGDVYYSGTEEEVKQRFLDLWPRRPGAVSRAINSNHEMYSGGEAYFRQTLPAFGQESSYFAYQNKHWTLVGLDVAYTDQDIDDEQVWWLTQILNNAGERKVIIFSHHQLYSHFDLVGTRLIEHSGFGPILASRRIFAWYWGHEHRCTIFETPDKDYGILARCIGHGGMPQSRTLTRALKRAQGSLYERADWRISPARTMDGRELPSAIVLEGPNPYIVTEEEEFTPHGYAVLSLDGPVLKEEVRDPKGDVIYDRVSGN